MFRFQSLRLQGHFASDPVDPRQHHTAAEFSRANVLFMPVVHSELDAEVIRLDQTYLSPAPQPALAAAPDAPPAYDEVHGNRIRLTTTRASATRSPFFSSLAEGIARTETLPAAGPYDTREFQAAIRRSGALESWVPETAHTGIFNGVSAGLLGLGVGKAAAIALLGPVLGGIVVVGGGSAIAQACHIRGTQSDHRFFEKLAEVLRLAVDRGLEGTVDLATLSALRAEASSANKRNMFNDFSTVLLTRFPNVSPEFHAVLALV